MRTVLVALLAAVMVLVAVCLMLAEGRRQAERAAADERARVMAVEQEAARKQVELAATLQREVALRNDLIAQGNKALVDEKRGREQAERRREALEKAWKDCAEVLRLGPVQVGWAKLDDYLRSGRCTDLDGGSGWVQVVLDNGYAITAEKPEKADLAELRRHVRKPDAKMANPVTVR